MGEAESKEKPWSTGEARTKPILDTGSSLSEEHDRLTALVEEAFRRSTSRFRVPTEQGCRLVATYLVFLTHPITGKSGPSTPTKAVKYGKLFLKHLACERRQISRLLEISRTPGVRSSLYWVDAWERALNHIDETRHNVELLLPIFPQKKDLDDDPFRKIGSLAREAWSEANGGQAPRATNPDSPLCRFVVAALEGIAKKHSPATVSEVLRGRRRPAKDGQRS